MTAPSVGADQFDFTYLDELRRVADPEADDVVANYIDGEIGVHQGKLMTALIAHGANTTDEEDAPLRGFVTARPALPDWTEPAMVERGQEIFAEYVAQFGLGLWMASIPAGYAAAKGAEVLTHTTRLVSDARRRFLETGQFIIDVMSPGALEPDGRGSSAIRHVRLMHASARHLLVHRDLPSGTCETCGHPFPNSHDFDVDTMGVPINQEDLLGTLFTFSVVGLDVIDRAGIWLSPADKEAYIHAWNVVGHGMGIRDDLLPLDFADSTTVFRRIQEHTYAPSPAGAQLTAAAIEVMQELIGLKVLRGLPAAGIREYLGDDIADLLEVPRAGAARLVFVPARALNRIASHAERDSKLLCRASAALGRRFFNGFLAYERQGAMRPEFELTDAIAKQLALR